MNYRRSKASGATFFFTVVTDGRRPVFSDEQSIGLLQTSFRHVIDRHPFIVDAFVIIPDHIHCMWTLPDGDNDFPKRWRLVKTYFTKHCDDVRAREKSIWQDRYWEHQIRDDVDYKRHVEYIHYNPVKHGLAQSPHGWLYSSFRRFVDDGIYPSDWGSNREIEFEDGIGKE